MTDIGEKRGEPIKSPWLVPKDKMPNKWVAISLLLIGFIMVIGAPFYILHEILSGKNSMFSFNIFIILLILGFIFILVGAVRFARYYGSKRYYEIMERENRQ